MHIAIVGPIGTDDIRPLLTESSAKLPPGYPGAPLLSSLIVQLIKNGHTVSAITLSKELALSKTDYVFATGHNFSITYCPMRPKAWALNGRRLGRIVDFFAYERNILTQAIKKVAPDIVHAHWAYEFGAAALDSGFPHVITSHDSPLDIAFMAKKEKLTVSGYRWLRAFIAKRVLKKAKIVTTVSPYLKHRIQKLTSCDVHVIPNPVDDLALSLATPKLPRATPEIAMVCNGWDARKNPEAGLLAFQRLVQDIPGATMHLYGNDFGPKQTAEIWCEANGITKGMHFHGATPHRQLLNALAQHDLLLHTSLEESFGMVIAEAMALGLPVVAGKHSGAVPWVVGTYGELCDVRSFEAVLSALKAALIPENYKKNSENGISSIQERFSQASVANNYFDYYRLAIDKSKPVTT